MSTIPCVVRLDLARHLRHRDRQEAQEDGIEALAAERYQWLTQDVSGIGEITESLYMDEEGFPLDDALFALYRAWLRKQPTADSMEKLMRLIHSKAQRMAREWAEKETAEAERETAETIAEAECWTRPC